jgi:hypothetical protein
MKDFPMRLAIAAALICTSAYAGPESLCPDIGDRAEEVMTFRQNNERMSEVMAKANGSEIIRELVVAAYALPLMQVQKNKDQMIVDFRNKVELQCYQQLKNS